MCKPDQNLFVFWRALFAFAMLFSSGVSRAAVVEACPYDAAAPGNAAVLTPPIAQVERNQPRTPLQESPYEKFNSRVAFRPNLIDTLVGSGEPETIFRHALGGLSFPQKTPTHIFVELDRGQLAIEVGGLDRASAREVTERLAGDQSVHTIVKFLSRGTKGRVKITVPAAGEPEFAPEIKVERLKAGPVPEVKKQFTKDKKDYIEYRYEEGCDNTQARKDLVEESVEVIYMPKGPWGHLAVRVGSRYFSYGMVGRWVNREFQPFPGSKGYGFKVPREKIPEVLKAMDVVTENSTKHNVPPYDVYAKRLEVVFSNGKLKYVSDTPATFTSGDAIIRNNEPVDAKVVQVGAESFLETPSGFRYPVKIENGKMYVDAINCVSSVNMVLGKFGKTLGVESQFLPTVTQQVEATLAPGNLGGETPDFVVDYGGLVK